MWLPGLGCSGTAFDESNVASENIFLNGPCAILHGDGTAVFCSPSPGTSSGTVSVTLDIHSDACTTGPCHSGIVHVAHIAGDSSGAGACLGRPSVLRTRVDLHHVP